MIASTLRNHARLALGSLSLLCACHTGNVTPSADAGAAAALNANEQLVLDLGAMPANCTRVSGWPILDFRGATRERVHVDGLPVAARDILELQGAESVRVRGTELRTAWHMLPDDLLPPVPAPRTLDLRLGKGVSRGVNVALNGRSLGRVVFGKAPPTTVSLPIAAGTLVAGRNELVLRATSKIKTEEISFSVDDVRVRNGQLATSITEDGSGQHAVGGKALHGLSLRPGEAIRCYVVAFEESRLHLSLGMQGRGNGRLEVWSTSDRAAPELLKSIEARPEADGPQQMQVSLTGNGTAGGAPRALELRAVSNDTGVRLLLGNTRLTVAGPMPEAPPPEKRAQNAVVVVWGSLSKASLPIYGGHGPATPTLDDLSRGSIVMDHMRASSTYSQGAMGSMLTGRSPVHHQATDSRSVLNEKLTTLGEAARESGIRTAYFTANPTTTRLLGFGRGWDLVEEVLPGSSIPASRVFERAATFVRTHADERWLVVIHARGGHPPWDADALELAALPPREYSGGIDPRSAGEWLEQVRRGRRPNRFTDADRARVSGLSDLSLSHHDAALGRLAEAVKATGKASQTSWMVVGDIAPNEALPLPFGEGEFPDEPQLDVPCVLSSVRSTHTEATHSPTAASSEDVASTVLAELGLPIPPSFGGVDLLGLKASELGSLLRVRVAMADGTSSLRLGDRVLQASKGTPGRLCDLGLEGSCITDVRATYPVSAATLEFAFAPWLSRTPAPRAHPVTIEASEAAARTAWGLP